MGLNMLMVYCEDSFEVKNQPYFGYMRSKYSQEELKELDTYASLFGIEMIPCVQTLAHLTDTLRWECFRDIKEDSSTQKGSRSGWMKHGGWGWELILKSMA